MVNMITDEQVRSALPWRAAVESLRAGFAGGSTATVPQRHHHAMSDAEDAPTLLLMPAWSHSYVGIKIVAVFPSNRGTDVPTINGNYLLMDGATGVPLAVLDGGELTARRTAAASVLAATLLSRPESSRLVVVGAGRLAGNLARAYAEHFALTDIAVWNHRPAGAERLAAELAGDGLPASATTELPSAVAAADIVTVATLSSESVVRGAWLAPGTHLDLVGAFTPTMREADDDAIRRAEVFVDTMSGALKEAGDIVQPLQSGVLSIDDIRGDLFALCTAPSLTDARPRRNHLVQVGWPCPRRPRHRCDGVRDGPPMNT